MTRLCAPVILLLLAPAALHAQAASFGGLHGTLLIRGGGPARGVVVRAQGPYGAQSIRTSESGWFSFDRLPEGRYTISVLSRDLCLEKPAAEITVPGGRRIPLPELVLVPCGGPKPPDPRRTGGCRPAPGQLARPAGPYLALAQENEVTLCRDGVPLYPPLKRHAARVTALAFSEPDLRFLASGSADATVVIWDVAAGREVRLLRQNGAVAKLTLSSDALYLAAVAQDSSLSVWHVGSGRRLVIPVRPLPLDWDPHFSNDAIRLNCVLRYPPGGLHPPPEVHLRIDEAAHLLAADPRATLAIEGHADRRSDGRDPGSVSQARAQEVRNLCLAAGIDPRRLRLASFGSSQPECDPERPGPCDENGNRRVILALEYRLGMAKAN